MPNEAAVYWKNRGDELAKQELYEEAIRCYENATRISPQYISAWNNFGYSLFKIGRINDANQIKIKIKELKKLESGQEIDIKGSEQKESQKKSRSFNIRVPAVQNKTQIKQDLSEKQIQIHEGIQNLSKTATKTSFKVLGSIGGAVGSIKEAVKAETRRISYNNLLKKHQIHIKKLIIDEFELKDLKKMCLYFNIGSPSDIRTNSRGYIYRARLTYDDWARFVFQNIRLTTLREYAKSNYKLPSKILEIEKKYKADRIEKYPEYERDDGTLSYRSDINDNPLLQELTDVINQYQPIKPFKNEELYHTNLYTHLCQMIPGEIGYEVQRGSSRPDIVVGDIAIEIKGPTDNQGLITIADKINRYSQHFEHIIVVLFEVQIFERFYNEWYEGIMRQYGDLVTIIRK